MNRPGKAAPTPHGIIRSHLILRGRSETARPFPMKILISAYACDPYRGSEAGVGWRAVCRIAQRHDVCVLTNPHNQEGWERAAGEGLIPPNIQVRFVQGSTSCSRSRFVARFQSWLNYASFNRRVFADALAWHAEEHFDLCHQVTIAGWRMPSPLWKLPIPFIWGPIGGAGQIPRSFRGMLSPSAHVFELARDLNTWWAKRQQDFKDCVRETAVIFAANEETREFLKPLRGDRPLIRLPIASFPVEEVARFRRLENGGWVSGPSRTAGILPAEHDASPKNPGWKPGFQNSLEGCSPLRLFAGGNMEGRKGVALALKALLLVKQSGVPFHYTVAGGGPDIPHLKKLANRLGIADYIEFNLGYQGDDYVKALLSTDVYFLPSFRESTPVTLLEAMLAGCFPVVADTSAQGEIVRLCGGLAVPARNMDSLIQGLADAIIWCARNRAGLPELTRLSAAKAADEFSSARYDLITEETYRIAGQQR